jgi:hypothetical protein
MTPRTTNQEGEAALVEAGHEMGVQVGFASGSTSTTLQGTALLPKSGGELVSEFQPGIAGAVFAAGFLLCMVATLTRRHH